MAEPMSYLSTSVFVTPFSAKMVPTLHKGGCIQEVLLYLNNGYPPSPSNTRKFVGTCVPQHRIAKHPRVMNRPWPSRKNTNKQHVVIKHQLEENRIKFRASKL